MGFKDAFARFHTGVIERFATRVYPARVAPFIQMIADELEDHPDDFNVHIFATEHGPYRVEVRYSEEVQRLVDGLALDEHSSLFAAQGVGVDFDLLTNRAVIVTHYFDAIELNWRESRLIHRAVDRMLAGVELDRLALQESHERALQQELGAA